MPYEVIIRHPDDATFIRTVLGIIFCALSHDYLESILLICLFLSDTLEATASDYSAFLPLRLHTMGDPELSI
jgi:hypothetical protein